jgi:hypothetical protein
MSGFRRLLLASAVLFSLAGNAHAADRSSRTKAGIALVAIGGLHVLTSIACGAVVAHAYASRSLDPDITGSVLGYPSLATGVIGGVLLGTGIPTLLRGLREDRAHTQASLIIEPSPTGLRLRW